MLLRKRRLYWINGSVVVVVVVVFNYILHHVKVIRREQINTPIKLELLSLLLLQS